MAGFPATGGHAPPRRRYTGRADGWTKDKRNIFLAMLSTCLNVRRAVEAVGLSYSAAYQFKRRNAEFAREWAEALDQGYENIELELMRQAIEGCERTETVQETIDGPVTQVKIVRTQPHGMALRLLQAHRVEVQVHRMGQDEREADEDVAARVRAHMDIVRERLRREAAERNGMGTGGQGDER